MKITHHKNQKGFSHHFIMPVLAILVVAGIGSYVMLRSSSAASVLKPCADYKTITKAWITCGQDAITYNTKTEKYLVGKINVRLKQTSKSYNYLQVKPLKTTRLVKKGLTRELVPTKWGVKCDDKNDTVKSGLLSNASVKIPKKTKAGYNVVCIVSVNFKTYKYTSTNPTRVYVGEGDFSNIVTMP